MKLQLVAPRTGVQWVRSGIRTFFRQPLALAALFFFYVFAIYAAKLIPLIGFLIALGLIPALTVGMMVATQQADGGKFPRPLSIVSPLRTSQAQTRSMLILGALYALAFVVILGISALIDGGGFAGFYLARALPADAGESERFRAAMSITFLLNVPLSFLFWHAAALVHWYELPVVKALFFSVVSAWRNIRAYLLFMFAWFGVSIFGALAVMILAAITDSEAVGSYAMLGFALMLSVMFICSIYFTFRDSFVPTQDSPGDHDDTTHIARP